MDLRRGKQGLRLEEPCIMNAESTVDCFKKRTRPYTAPTAYDLRLAITQRNEDAVQKLIKSGVDLNVAVRGTTAVSLAIYRGFVEIAELLIRAGADVNRLSNDHLERLEPPLCSACRLGNANAVSLLLKAQKIDVNQRDFFNKTPLWIAAKERRPDLVETLLGRPDLKLTSDVWSESALYMSTRYRGRRKIAEMLIRRGCTIDVEDMEDRTPLHWTLQNSDRRIFVLLLLCGASTARFQTTKVCLPVTWMDNLELCDWLLASLQRPLSLKTLARNSVRRWMSSAFHNINQELICSLDLPRSLRDFVDLADFDEMNVT